MTVVRYADDLLPLQCFQKAPATGVVMGVCRLTHTRDHVVLPEHLHIRSRGVPDAPIGMMHDRVLPKGLRELAHSLLGHVPPSWCRCANVHCLNLGVQSKVGIDLRF
jgi:hypothetical protein